MKTIVQIAFLDMTPSEALEAQVRGEVTLLRRFFDRITSCRVTIAIPHRRHQTGSLFSIHIRLAVPREELVIDHQHQRRRMHADPYFAVHNAFHAARRELEDYVRRMRGDVKSHVPRRAAGGRARQARAA